MQNTKIEWCDATINPITGCYHECEFCYARRITNRFGTGREKIIGGKTHVLDTPMHNTQGKTEPYPYRFTPTFHRYKLPAIEKELARMEKQGGKTVFVGSMADVFGDWVPDGWIDEIFELLDKHPKNRYLFLTKNPKRYCEYMVPKWTGWKVSKHVDDEDFNYWYGTTITGNGDLDRFNYLPAFTHTFISLEPLCNDIDADVMFTQAEWFIIGAETGNRKDKVVPKKKWIDHIVSECRKNAKPIFMKDSLIPIVGKDNMLREFPW